MQGLGRNLVNLGRETWLVLVRGPGAPLSFATALLLLWQCYGYPATYYETLDDLVGPWRYRAVAPSLYWFATNAIMLFAVPLGAARFLWKRPARNLGLGLGNWRVGLPTVGISCVLLFPLIILVAPWSDFRSTYPLDPNALRSHELFWVYEAGYASFFVGWEFFFRGFLLFTLEPALGPAAIAVQMAPFALMHVGKPVAEMLGSVVAGLFLGVLAWRTRSVWYGVAIHAAVALSMDFVVYARWGLNP